MTYGTLPLSIASKTLFIFHASYIKNNQLKSVVKGETVSKSFLSQIWLQVHNNDLTVNTTAFCTVFFIHLMNATLDPNLTSVNKSKTFWLYQSLQFL